MIAEPLNQDKIIRGYDLHGKYSDEIITMTDLSSAVEWLKNKFIAHRKNNDLYRLSEDESWSMAEDWIDEAFVGVTKK